MRTYRERLVVEVQIKECDGKEGEGEGEVMCNMTRDVSCSVSLTRYTMLPQSTFHSSSRSLLWMFRPTCLRLTGGTVENSHVTAKYYGEQERQQVLNVSAIVRVNHNDRHGNIVNALVVNVVVSTYS